MRHKNQLVLLVQLVEWVSHVQRLCPRCSSPVGPLLHVTPPFSHPVSSRLVRSSINKGHIKAKKILKKTSTFLTNWTVSESVSRTNMKSSCWWTFTPRFHLARLRHNMAVVDDDRSSTSHTKVQFSSISEAALQSALLRIHGESLSDASGQKQHQDQIRPDRKSDTGTA